MTSHGKQTIDNITMELCGQISDELLICQICYNHYTSLEKLPKLLFCSHTFCAECITNYLRKRKKSKHKFPCPLCRRESHLGKDGVAGLANNLTVMGLMDIMDRQQLQQQEQQHQQQQQQQETASRRHRPALQHVAWGPPPISSKGIQCDNCDATSVRGLVCGHVFCDACMRKCDGGDCIQCSIVGIGARSKTPPHRPPAVNPAYNEQRSPHHTSASAPVMKPAVPQRSSPVKPLGGLSPVDVSSNPHLPGATSLSPVHARTSLSPQISPIHTLPRSPRPHTMHVSSTLPVGSAAFGMTLPGRVTLPSADSTQSLPEVLHHHHHTSPHRHRPPQPPTRRISAEGTALASPLRCLTKFGSFSPVRFQTNAFHQPTHITCSEFTGDWAVVDAVNMSLQIFDLQGSYISLFKVLGIKSVCFISPDRLAVCTHRGVEIYQPDGTSLRELPIGRTDSVAAFKHGFIAAQPRCLHFYSQSFTPYREVSRRVSGKLKRGTSFQQIVDVAVTANKDIVVLDSKLGDITVMDDHGKVILIIQPASEPCGKLRAPEALAVDRNGNVIISDSGNQRLLRFSANGMFSRCLLNFTLGSAISQRDISVHGVAIAKGGAMAVVIAGTHIAEVRVYQLM